MVTKMAEINETNIKCLLLKHFFAFFVTFVSLFSTVNTFRGYWFLMDEYLLPGKYQNNSEIILV
jgi:hypothetical protein